MSRKYEAIDLMKLFSLGSANGWNEFLTECYHKQDVNKLAKVKYQIQAGMDDLVKLKGNSEEMNVWFIRLCRSIDLTAKKIIKQKHPLPGDNPLIASTLDTKELEIKRRRDRELEQFLLDSSY